MSSTTLGAPNARDIVFAYGVEDTAFTGDNTRSVARMQPTGMTKLILDDVGTQGATVTQQEDDPLGGDNQRRQGRTTGLTSGFGWTGKIRKGQFETFVPSFMFTSSFDANLDVARLPVTAVTSSGFTVTMPTPAGAATAARNKLPADTLVYVTGTGVGDGLHVIQTQPTASAIAVVTAPSSTATGLSGNLASVGKRFSGTGVTAAYSTTTAELTFTFSTAAGLDTKGLAPGQLVFIGSPDPTGGYRHGIGANAFGFATVKSLTSTSLVLKDVPTRLKLGATYTSGAGDATDILFSRTCLNSVRGDADFREDCYTFSARYPGQGSGSNAATGADSNFEFSFGNVPSTFSCTFNPNELATYSIEFMGLDTDVHRDGNASPADPRVALAVGAGNDILTSVYNTTSDFGRLRFRKLDDTSLMSIFSSMTFSISTNSSPKDTLNVLGSAHINYGQYMVTMSGVPVFNRGELSQLVRESTNVSGAWVIQNDQGVMGFSIPTIQLADGSRTYTRDDVVEINLTGNAHADNEFGKTMIFSTIDMPLALKESE